MIRKVEGSRSGASRVLVYYFAFPHYRRSILRVMQGRLGGALDVASGRSERGGIRALSGKDLGGLEILPTSRIAGFTFDHGIVLRASSVRYDAVVLGPAFSSVSTWLILLLRFVTRRRTYLWGDCGHHQGLVRALLQELMSRMSTGLLVYGEASARGACRLGTPRSKVHIVRNGVESNALRWSEESGRDAYWRMREGAARALEEGDLTLVHVGRLTPDKRLDVLLDALPAIREKFPKVRLRVIGDGPDLVSLKRHPSSSLVEFLGAVYDSQERASLIAAGTLVVSPWVMGLLAVDALREGVPVILPDNPLSGSEVESLSLGVNALSFQAGVAADLARAVNDWIQGAREVDESRFIAARREALIQWDPSSVAERILRVVR